MNSPFEAWFIPGFQPESFAEYVSGRAVIRVPRLQPDDVSRIAEHLQAAGAVLREMPVARIIAAVDAAAALLAESRFRDQALELIPLVTGLSSEMTALIHDRMLQDWRAPALQALLDADLGSPAVLDGFVRRAGTGTRTHAVGPDLAFQVFSGNVPGVAVTSLVRALLVKTSSLCKSALGEPVLPVLFLRALQMADAEIAAAAAVTYWPGGTRDLEDVALQRSDAVIVYGGGAVVDELRSRVSSNTRFLEHGPRVSIGIVNRTIRDAEDIATSVAVFDQQGCVSPHVIYVLGSLLDARELARALAHHLEQLERTLPRGTLEPAESVAVHQLRAEYEFRTIAGTGTELYQSAATEWTVVCEPEPALQTSCLNRFVFVKPIPSIDALSAQLAPYRQLLQSVGISGFDDAEAAELARKLGRIGAVRIAPFSSLPWPPPWWHHDGRGPLNELIRWVDLD